MSNLIPVLIVDDQLIQREGITRVVEATGRMRVVGAVSSGAEAMHIAEAEPLELALVDLVLQHEHGTQVGRDLSRLCPTLKVIIYTREKSMVLAAEIFREEKEGGKPGLQGYLLTRNILSSDTLLQVYRNVVESGYYIDPDVLRWYYQFAKLEKLTRREEECARLIARGLSNSQIAESMVVSRRRVENLINSLYQKFRILGESSDPARRVILVESIRLLNSVAPAQQGMSILVIEDQPEQQARICGALRADKRFRSIEEAGDGQAGIEAAERMRPEVVLVDVHLPDLDGFEVTQRILERLPQTKIVMTSGERSPLYEKMSLEAGAIAFVPKDLMTPEALARACDSWEP